jgi:hypothetical protein
MENTREIANLRAQLTQQQQDMALQAEQTRAMMQEMQQNNLLMRQMMQHMQPLGAQAAPVSAPLVPTSAAMVPASAAPAPFFAPPAPVSAPLAPVFAPPPFSALPRPAVLAPGLDPNAPPAQVTFRGAPVPLHPPPGRSTTKGKGRAPSARTKATAAKGKAVDHSGQAPIVPSSSGPAPVVPSSSGPAPVMPSSTVPALHNPHGLNDEQRVELATKQVASGLYPDENDGIARVGQMSDPHPYKDWHSARSTRLSAIHPKPPVMSDEGVHAQPHQLPGRPDFGNIGDWCAKMDAAIKVLNDTRVLLSEEFRKYPAVEHYSWTTSLRHDNTARLGPDGGILKPPKGDEDDAKKQYRLILWLYPTEDEIRAIHREQFPHVAIRIVRISTIFTVLFNTDRAQGNAKNARAAYNALIHDDAAQQQNDQLSGTLLDICKDMAVADQQQQIFLLQQQQNRQV